MRGWDEYRNRLLKKNKNQTDMDFSSVGFLLAIIGSRGGKRGVVRRPELTKVR